jgi:hypothetical protein
MGPEEEIEGTDSIPCAFGALTAGVHRASGKCTVLSGAHPVSVRRCGMCLAVDLIRGLSVIAAEMTGAEVKSQFTILAYRQHSQHRRAIARFGHYTFAEVILISGQEKGGKPLNTRVSDKGKKTKWGRSSVG